MREILTDISIDSESLEFTEGFNYKGVPGIEVPGFSHEQWGGWLEVELPLRYADLVKSWIVRKPKVLMFRTTHNVSRYMDFDITVFSSVEEGTISFMIRYGKQALVTTKASASWSKNTQKNSRSRYYVALES